MLNRTLLLSVFALALTACGPSHDQNPAAATPEPVRSDIAAAPVAASTPTGPQPTGPQYLTLEESTVDLCKHADGLMATQVSWDASSLPTEGVEVWLQSPGEERKLWAATTPKGTERTGTWLRSGSKVILVNGADKSVLQEIIVTEQPCANTR